LRNETHRAPFANDAFRSSTHPIYYLIRLVKTMHFSARLLVYSHEYEVL